MLRSVMVKGIEALTAECFLAARKAGVADEVAASLDASWPGTDWAARADYNLGRMREHGLRRAAEMEEVAATLEALGEGSDMARATARGAAPYRRRRKSGIGGRMIIDCHGHYTTAPAAHNDWRDAQKAAFKAGEAPPPYPAISDDEIRETLEKNQLRLLRERGADMTIFSPRASAMAHHVGDEEVSKAWARANNDLIARCVALYPETFAGVCMLPQNPKADLAGSIEELSAASPSSASSAATSIPIPAAAISPARRSPTVSGIRSTRRWSSSTCRR